MNRFPKNMAFSTNPQAALTSEAVLDPTIYPQNITWQFTPEPNCILLTGATGFLGPFLLWELLEQTQADIYCLIRSANADLARKKIQNRLEDCLLWNESFRRRIIPVVGDLSQPLFGLSEQQFQVMARQVDVIYHNGATVSHVSPYHVLKAPNVLGTQEVLRLASQIKIKPVHFTSTINVFSPGNNSGEQLIREQDSLDNSGIPSMGYRQSKWVAEKLLMIGRDRGIPVCIYRSGLIFGHTQTGVCNVNDNLQRLIIGCVQLGSAPTGDMTIDAVPVDYISKAIVYLSKQQESYGKTFHFVNPQPSISSQFIECIRAFGYPIRQISYDKWLAELINIVGNSPEHPLYPLLMLNNAASQIRNSQGQMSNPPELKFDCQNTLTGLAGTSIICPIVDEQLFNTCILYLIRSNFIKPPHYDLQESCKC